MADPWTPFGIPLLENGSENGQHSQQQQRIYSSSAPTPYTATMGGSYDRLDDDAIAMTSSSVGINWKGTIEEKKEHGTTSLQRHTPTTFMVEKDKGKSAESVPNEMGLESWELELAPRNGRNRKDSTDTLQSESPNESQGNRTHATDKKAKNKEKSKSKASRAQGLKPQISDVARAHQMPMAPPDSEPDMGNHDDNEDSEPRITLWSTTSPNEGIVIRLCDISNYTTFFAKQANRSYLFEDETVWTLIRLAEFAKYGSYDIDDELCPCRDKLNQEGILPLYDGPNYKHGGECPGDERTVGLLRHGEMVTIAERFNMPALKKYALTQLSPMLQQLDLDNEDDIQMYLKLILMAYDENVLEYKKNAPLRRKIIAKAVSYPKLTRLWQTQEACNVGRCLVQGFAWDLCLTILKGEVTVGEL